jgi:hypothetical protein
MPKRQIDSVKVNSRKSPKVTQNTHHPTNSYQRRKPAIHSATMTANSIENCIHEIITYDNFIQQAKQHKQAKTLELAQSISAIMEPTDTFFYKNQRKICDILK